MCLMNLKEQIYPGATGVRTGRHGRCRCCAGRRQQGGVGGYAHSGSGLQIDPAAATARCSSNSTANKDGQLDASEAARGLLPEPFAEIDADRDGTRRDAS